MQNISGNWQKQKRNKPKIENVITEIITDSEMKKTALDFIAHLRKNNYGIVWSVANEWWVTISMQPICKISLRDDGWADDEHLNNYSWIVSLCLHHMNEYEESIINENLQDFICNYDPNETAIKCVKRLLDLDKKAEGIKTKNTPSLHQQQKAVKPLVEDIIPEYLDDDMKKAALDFIAWLRANKMSPGWTSANCWLAKCKGKDICNIGLGNSVWNNSKIWLIGIRLTHMNEYEDSIINENLQNFILDNMNYCFDCWRCTPGIDATLFGKECKELCHKPGITVCDPDEAALDKIKRLLELEKKARAESGG